MSNALAIATVTATLQSALQSAVDVDAPGAVHGTKVSALRPDALGHTPPTKGVNIYLYQASPNAAWRNADVPTRGSDGRVVQRPTVALDLHYILTFYGDDSQFEPQRLLATVARTLHAQPLLTRDMIRQTIGGALFKPILETSDLAEQIELVRFTPTSFSLEELSKLWSVFFQTAYTLTMAYQGTVVLIESDDVPRAALPVLKRGQEDRGVFALASSSPTLSEARPPSSRPSAQLGDDLILTGQQLRSDGVTVRFSGRRPPDSIPLLPSPASTADQLIVHLPTLADDPDALVKWAAGFYTVALLVQHPNLPTWATNEVSFALAPTITVAPGTASAGDSLTVTCAPQVRAEQRVVVLFGEHQVPVDTIATPTDASQSTTLTFAVPAVPAASYVVRLRVDGVDSIPIVRGGPPEFDPRQTVVVT